MHAGTTCIYADLDLLRTLAVAKAVSLLSMKFNRLKLLELLLLIAVIATLLFIALQLLQDSPATSDDRIGIYAVKSMSKDNS